MGIYEGEAVRIAIKADPRKADEALLINALRNAPHVTLTVIRDKVPRTDADLHCIIGVKHAKLMRALEVDGLPYLFWDKGYNREWPRWWRVSFNSHQPVKYLTRQFPADRAASQGWLRRFRPWRPYGVGTVLFAGASAKYHAYHELPDPTTYAADVVRQLQALTPLNIVYRPKPSWSEAEAVAGARFSRGREFSTDLEAAGVLVTHGSSACFEALLAGVPSIVLGDGVTRPISSTTLEDVRRPKLASDDDRYKLLCALAYFQWSVDEISSNGVGRIMECFNATGVLQSKIQTG